MAAALQGLTAIQQFTLRMDASSEEPHAVAALQIPHTASPGGTRLHPLSLETREGEGEGKEMNRTMLGEKAQIHQGDGGGDGVVMNLACL